MKTKVIFRTFRDGGDAIALFPEIPGSSCNWYLCESYMHIGQHGSADTAIVHDTRKSTPEEVAPLKSELEQIGYDLEVRLRVTSKMNAARRKAWEDSRKPPVESGPEGLAQRA